ncbi:hypothetical protein B5807_01752 [Epicoccum nigrum]|uniref:Uncharacterized protein n=1 Tax=Epicoccum nigrum TaxID=105696 RepID=A0A1Y2MGE0_EPING|nr:hypothetical protein B5807_01752 [Epicoccum nigrum]
MSPQQHTTERPELTSQDIRAMNPRLRVCPISFIGGIILTSPSISYTPTLYLFPKPHASPTTRHAHHHPLFLPPSFSSTTFSPTLSTTPSASLFCSFIAPANSPLSPLISSFFS